MTDLDVTYFQGMTTREPDPPFWDRGGMSWGGNVLFHSQIGQQADKVVVRRRADLDLAERVKSWGHPRFRIVMGLEGVVSRQDHPYWEMDPVGVLGGKLASDEMLGVWHYGSAQVIVLESPEQEEMERNLRRLAQSDSHDDVLAALDSAGYSKQVEQLRHHLVERDAILEDGEQPGIRFESLQAVARFMVSNRDLPFSSIKVDFSGSADLSWYLSPRRQEHDGDDMFWIDGGGQITLRFVTPNLIEFAMLSGPWTNGAERLSLTGTMSHMKMRAILDMFSNRMISYNE